MRAWLKCEGKLCLPFRRGLQSTHPITHQHKSPPGTWPPILIRLGHLTTDVVHLHPPHTPSEGLSDGFALDDRWVEGLREEVDSTRGNGIATVNTDSGKRDDFCRALVNQLVEFSFEGVFSKKFDFFATIFEYLIQDYNKDGGGKYAEYYTPHAVAEIMAAILVPEPVRNVTAYDPAAGSGSLLMSLAHAIGEDRCTLYSQDISQKNQEFHGSS